MLVKLVRRNVGRSIRDYAVYFLTLLAAVAIFYIFNSVSAQRHVLTGTPAMSMTMNLVEDTTPYLSIFVAMILGLLIVYANRYFIRRRKQELGIYLLLGMNKRKVSLILVMETAFIAILALVCGLLLGIFLSQFMSIIVANMFETNLERFHFVFSPSAVRKSILYFGLIFLIVIVFNVLLISRLRIINLLYGRNRNEKFRVEKGWISMIAFLLSVAGLWYSYHTLNEISIIGFVSQTARYSYMLLVGLLSTILFFFSLMGFVNLLMKGFPKLYHRGLNAFVIRQMTSKFHTNYLSISIVCLTLLITIGIFGSGYSVRSVVNDQMRDQVPFDIELSGHEAYYDPDYYDPDKSDQRPSTIKEILPEHFLERPEIQGAVYYSPYDFELKAPEQSHENKEGSPSDFGDLFRSERLSSRVILIEAIRLSDYNQLMRLAGRAEISLSEGEYALIGNLDVNRRMAEEMIAKRWRYQDEQHLLFPAKEILPTSYRNGSFTNVSAVVPDEVLRDRKITKTNLCIQCVNKEAAERLVTEIMEIRDTRREQGLNTSFFLLTRKELYETALSTRVLISFICVYIGLTFMVASAALLSIQQLSEVVDNKRRYAMLYRLGADQAMLDKALFQQILLYFLMPLLLAMVHSYVGLRSAIQVIGILGNIHITKVVVSTILFVLVIYLTYFLLTYMNARQSIRMKGWQRQGY